MSYIEELVRSQRAMTAAEHDEFASTLSAESAAEYRKYWSNIARQAHEADELFKHRLIIVIIVIVFIVLFVLPSPSVQEWINGAAPCIEGKAC